MDTVHRYYGFLFIIIRRRSFCLSSHPSKKKRYRMKDFCRVFFKTKPKEKGRKEWLLSQFPEHSKTQEERRETKRRTLFFFSPWQPNRRYHLHLFYHLYPTVVHVNLFSHHQMKEMIIMKTMNWVIMIIMITIVKPIVQHVFVKCYYQRFKDMNKC